VFALTLALWLVLLALMSLEAMSEPQRMNYAFDAFFYSFLCITTAPPQSSRRAIPVS
jgi:hypothetical protein